jgi:catechol 2,3-dioxygenase-like lactoylglutathione lyase family enzyme
MLTDRFHHFAVAVRDLPAAVSWYCGKLDLRVEKEFSIPDARLDIVKLISAGGARIELLKSHAVEIGATDRPSLNAPGSMHMCFHVADIERATEVLRSRGVRITQEPRHFPEIGEKNCWIADPEGNLIEFIQEM